MSKEKEPAKPATPPPPKKPQRPTTVLLRESESFQPKDRIQGRKK